MHLPRPSLLPAVAASVQSTNGTHFCETADDWEWLPGVLETLRALHAAGFKLAVCTNQGVDKPMSTVLGRMTNVARQAEAHGAPLQVCACACGRVLHPDLGEC